MRTVFAASAVALALVLTGCNGGSGSGQTTSSTLNLTVKAGAGENSGPGSSCGSANFGTLYFDLPNTQVTVTNEAGVTVGIGEVPKTGKIARRDTPGGPLGLFTEDCVFTVSIPLDGAAKFYKVDLGPRFGSRQVSQADLDAQNGAVVLDLSAD